jgi:membrane associated rhomboid family serine protease
MSVVQSLPVLGQQLLLAGALVVSLAVARRLGGGAFARARRRRLVVGLPWGTLLTVGVVLVVYLFVQDGWSDLYSPMVVPFRAYSYFYPMGMVLAGLSHNGFGHLFGNLVGALAFGSLAEYAWGHYPTRRGSRSFGSLRTNPFARIGAFALAGVATAVLTGLFGAGPVIGFSGVVFAYAGFALMRYPLGVVVALFVGRVIGLLFNAFQSPTAIAMGREQFVRPSWVGVALQGHLLGLFLGALVGALLVRSRGADERPDGARLWAGVLLFAVAQNLWTVYVPLGGERYRLFRAAGAAFVLLLAALLSGAALSSDRRLIGRIDLRYREVALGLTMAVLLALALVAVPLNLFTVDEATATVETEGDAGVTVEDYTVLYAEQVPDRYVSSVAVEAFGQTTRVNASGMIVISERRNIWWNEVSAASIAASGQGSVRVGGLGWRRTVVANRTEWSPVGNRSAYVVHLESGDRRQLAFTSEPSVAEPTVAGRNVTVVPGEPFRLRVTRENRTLGTTPVPVTNATVEAGGLRFERVDNGVFAVRNETRVRVATRPTD